MIMRETRQSLRVYCIVVALVNIMWAGSLLISDDVRMQIAGVVTLVMAAPFFYFGIKLDSYLQDAPYTLLRFIAGILVITALLSAIGGAYLYVLFAAVSYWYLAVNIKRLSREANMPEDNVVPEPRWPVGRIIAGAVIVSLLVGNVWFVWRQSQRDDMRRRAEFLVTDTKSDNTATPSTAQTGTEQSAAARSEILQQEYEASAWCTASPLTTETGRLRYPILPAYEKLPWLGQFFTAFHCGSERVRDLPSVSDERYTFGSRLWLRDKPDQKLIQVLQTLGYQCISTAADDGGCIQWELTTSVQIYDMIQLEPFYEEFIADDCVHCG